MDGHGNRRLYQHINRKTRVGNWAEDILALERHTPGGMVHFSYCKASSGAIRGSLDVTTAEIRRPSFTTADL